MENGKKNRVQQQFQLKEVLLYFFRRKDPERPVNFNIRAMHGINKISIIIFLLGIIFFILKRFL
ncbi:MAG: hypothetical protein OEY51_05430 [Cyclobacteriaceae bacterium]|nr:hypothetical protein [Cyclobacteriaceae bacterium]